jgi:16S rRNA G1207 methylase RsmC
MPVDLVALPFSATGEAELTRDLMQAGHELLQPRGTMITSTDNPRDQWLHAEMRKLFQSVTRRAAERGVTYMARKADPLTKLKDFSAEFMFRAGPRLIRVYTRPGVFSHRRLDPGARQVIRAMQVNPGDRVLDIGCGAGVLSLAAAMRAEGVRVHAVDSNARAIQCAAKGAELNGLTNITTELNASGEYEGQGTFDVALANPPYYAAHDIARRFLVAARSALKPGGRILAVTKSPEWYEENMHQWFDDVRLVPSQGYVLAEGRNPG